MVMSEFFHEDNQNSLEEKYCTVFSMIESLQYFPNNYAKGISDSIIENKAAASYIGLKQLGLSHFRKEDRLYIKGKKIRDFSKIYDDFKQLDFTQFILTHGRDIFSLNSILLKELQQIKEIISLELQILFLKELRNKIPKPKYISYCLSFKRKYFICFAYQNTRIHIHFGSASETPIFLKIDEIISIIREYEEMDIHQFILAHSKNPFGLNHIPSFKLDTREI